MVKVVLSFSAVRNDLVAEVLKVFDVVKHLGGEVINKFESPIFFNYSFNLVDTLQGSVNLFSRFLGTIKEQSCFVVKILSAQLLETIKIVHSLQDTLVKF